MRIMMVASLAGLLVFSEQPAFSQYQTKALNPQEAYERGVQAYLYGYPLVLMSLTCQVFTRRAPMNQFQHAQTFPTADFRRVVRPNVDTLYSIAWLDVSREPIVMSVPDTRGRYYLVQMLDAWTETFAVPGARTTGTKARQFAIVGPEWSGAVPSQMTTIRAPTNLVWMIGRIQTNGPDDYPNVHALQQGFRLAPLRTSTGGVSSPTLAASAQEPIVNLPPPAQVARMDAVAFFTAFADAMKHNPPHADDACFIAPFSAIGLEPGKAFDNAGLDVETRRSLERAVGDAQRQVPNPLNRYAVGDRDHLRFNEDGSLDVYIQRNQPSDIQVQNWLPAPSGVFNLLLRLYWPKPEVGAGRWTPPSVQRSL